MNIHDTLKRFVYKVQDFRPTPLPVGLTAFNEWCDRLSFTYFPPGANPPDDSSFRFSIAAMIMHLDSQSARKPNRFFGKAIYKGAANEVASYVMHDLKAKRDALIRAQEAEAAAAAQAQLAEATANLAGASNGQPEQRVQSSSEAVG